MDMAELEIAAESLVIVSMQIVRSRVGFLASPISKKRSTVFFSFFSMADGSVIFREQGGRWLMYYADIKTKKVVQCHYSMHIIISYTLLS